VVFESRPLASFGSKYQTTATHYNYILCIVHRCTNLAIAIYQVIQVYIHVHNYTSTASLVTFWVPLGYCTWSSIVLGRYQWPARMCVINLRLFADNSTTHSNSKANNKTPSKMTSASCRRGKRNGSWTYPFPYQKCQVPQLNPDPNMSWSGHISMLTTRPTTPAFLWSLIRISGSVFRRL